MSIFGNSNFGVLTITFKVLFAPASIILFSISFFNISLITTIETPALCAISSTLNFELFWVIF